MDVRRVIGANVRKYRLEADMTQARVAEVMGVDRAYISALERGERNPTAISLWQAAEALGVHVTALLDDRVDLTVPENEPRRRARKQRQ
jgi:transcriptional regulator with XRE-family HTH domain